MIESAMREFDIDRSGSFVIGNDDRGMGVAKNADIRSIRVREGGELKGDFFAEDFYDVLEIIKRQQR